MGFSYGGFKMNNLIKLHKEIKRIETNYNHYKVIFKDDSEEIFLKNGGWVLII